MAAVITTEKKTAALTIKMELMTILSRRILHHYGGSKPFGAWTRASQETGISNSHLSYLSHGQHQYFSIDRLLNLADQLGMNITIHVD